mgnify:CR=1 FL=1
MEGMERYRPRLLAMDEGGAIGEDLQRFLLPDGLEEDGALAGLKKDLFGTGHNLPPPRTPIRYRVESCGSCETAVRMQEAAVDASDPYSIIFLFLDRISAQEGVLCACRLWAADPWTEVVLCAAPGDFTLEETAMACGGSDHLLLLRRPLDALALRQIARAMAMKWWLIHLNRMRIEQFESDARRRTVELEAAVARLEAEAALRHDREYELARQSRYDALTGLLNRQAFHELLAQSLAGSGAPGTALLVVNIDRFRVVNEQFGQDMGDRLLSELAARMRNCAGSAAVRLAVPSAFGTRERETVLPADQAIFRVAGDEFALLLLPGGRSDIRATAERIREVIAEPFDIRGQCIHVTCSIGVSWLQEGGGDFGRILRQADSAMYKARERGNAVVFQDELRGTGWMDPADLASDIETAVRAGGFEVFFQRILEEDGRLAGMSAVSRWRHARFGLIQPDAFLPVAEHMGLLSELERGQLAVACRQAGSLSTSEYRNLFILFHCADDTWLDASFPECVRRILRESGLSPERLKLSVNASLLARMPALARTLAEISASGVGLLVKGVGLGQSLNLLLRDLPSDVIVQPDRGLLAAAAKRNGERLSLLNLIEQLRERGVRMLAGNVETAAQEELVGRRGCLLQGFLYGGPVPFDLFVRDLDKAGRTPAERE